MTEINLAEGEKAIFIRVLQDRLDGASVLLAEVRAGDYMKSTIELVEIDLESVEYINSLGITELVTLKRLFSEASLHPVQMRLLNVDRRVNAILELLEIHKMADVRLRDSDR
ncbi:MAG: hypothetical protein H7A21_13860 [Spirochaetales bacterium]|nr:hypothetical protein [Leptospiraceae bacterium]MCP5482517.1 hypothetical protein [Spirochaetales bacterium]MCP5485107.1 hypothetical protein [Spirochaetales bacterium]